MDPLRPSFEVELREARGAARTGRLSTLHGTLTTPAFLPVATFGAVRGLAPDELRAVGVEGLLCNTYHLHLRPGEDLVAALGGLHAFTGWPGPMLTDSGGFQVYSLDRFCTRSEDGVEFASPIDGARHFLSPEACIEIQEKLGADLIVVLDEFEPIDDQTAPRQAREGMERTLRWARRGRERQTRTDQLLFGIVQGGGHAELRAESAARTAEIGFEAFAIGGLGVGESAQLRCALLETVVRELPPEAPRYLMGLGQPEDLLDAVERGVDLFDCVVPTRNGRHGTVFTREGRLNLRNGRYREDAAPLDAACGCPACARYSRAYLRHLLKSGEVLAARMLSLHNLAFYMDLMRQLRAAIAENRLQVFLEVWRKRYGSGPEPASSAGSSSATDSAA